MKLRVEEPAWKAFSSSLRANRDLETAGIVLARPAHGAEAMVAERLLPVPESGYAIRKRDQLQISPVALNQLVRKARLDGLSIFTAHTHPGTETPWFSQADDIGDARLMPSFYMQSPGPHGSIVIAGSSGKVAARVWTEEKGPEHLDVRVVGRCLKLLSSVESESSERWFDRQVLALGRHGQRSLERLHVGVVGLGGTGSVCLAQLAHLGIRAITLVDGDIVAASNLSRIIGAMTADVGRTPKVDVAARYLDSLGLGAHVRALRGDLGREVGVEQLGSCDVIFSCVDRFSPRVLLNRTAYRSLIPVIDMGSAFRVDHTGRVASCAGRAVVVGPGRPCLGCWGHIDARQVHIESLSESDRADQQREGYIEGAEVQQPSIIPFNTVVSGAALVELLRLVTEFSGSEDPPNRLLRASRTAAAHRGSGVRLQPERFLRQRSKARRVAAKSSVVVWRLRFAAIGCPPEGLWWTADDTEIARGHHAGLPKGHRWLDSDPTGGNRTTADAEIAATISIRLFIALGPRSYSEPVTGNGVS